MSNGGVWEMARIALPEHEDVFTHVMTRLGSPRLNRRVTEGWEAQYDPDATTLTPREREAARIRSAYLVGCGSCIAFRAARDIPGFCDDEIPEGLYENVFAYRTWPGYSERERLIIEFTERYSE